MLDSLMGSVDAFWQVCQDSQLFTELRMGNLAELELSDKEKAVLRGLVIWFGLDSRMGILLKAAH